MGRGSKSTTGAGEWIVLLRAIGPATHGRMNMAELRAACEAVGLKRVRTVLATGNLILSSPLSAEGIYTEIRTIVQSHGLDNEVFIRRPSELETIIAANPMPEAATERPNHLLVLFMHTAPDPNANENLRDHSGPEVVLVQGREVFIDYRNGVARSKLTAAILERRIGQPGTARNWNTVRKLAAAVQ